MEARRVADVIGDIHDRTDGELRLIQPVFIFRAVACAVGREFDVGMVRGGGVLLRMKGAL